MANWFVSIFVAIASSLVFPTPVNASVIYDLNGSLDLGVTVATFGFVYTAPDFITPPLTVLAADLDSCELTIFTTNPCSSVEFAVNPDVLIITSLDGLSSIQIAFSSELLSRTGTTTSSVFTLIVTQQPGTPVPEPISIALVGLGLAGMAVRRWRQRTTSRISTVLVGD